MAPYNFSYTLYIWNIPLFKCWHFDACFVCHCVLYICCLQQSMSLSSLSCLSACQNKWTASTSPATRCDRFFSLSMSLQAALLPTHTLYHSETRTSSFCGPVTEHGNERKKKRGVQGNQYLKKTNKRAPVYPKIQNISQVKDEHLWETLKSNNTP